jgi:hypothetical protein
MIVRETVSLLPTEIAIAILALSSGLIITFSLTIFILIKIKRLSNSDYPRFYSLPKDRSPAQISDEEERAFMDAFDVKQYK